MPSSIDQLSLGGLILGIICAHGHRYLLGCRPQSVSRHVANKHCQSLSFITKSLEQSRKCLEFERKLDLYSQPDKPQMCGALKSIKLKLSFVVCGGGPRNRAEQGSFHTLFLTCVDRSVLGNLVLGKEPVLKKAPNVQACSVRWLGHNKIELNQAGTIQQSLIFEHKARNNFVRECIHKFKGSALE